MIKSLEKYVVYDPKHHFPIFIWLKFRRVLYMLICQAAPMLW